MDGSHTLHTETLTKARRSKPDHEFPGAGVPVRGGDSVPGDKWRKGIQFFEECYSGDLWPSQRGVRVINMSLPFRKHVRSL